MSIICNPNPTPIDLNSTHIFRRLTKNFDGIELHSRNYSTFHIKKANHHIAMSGSETRFRTTQPTQQICERLALEYTDITHRCWYLKFRPTKHTHPFNGPFSGSTRGNRYQKGKTNVDFTEARDSEWQ